MGLNLSFFLLFVLPFLLVFGVTGLFFFVDYRTKLLRENRRQPIQYSYYLPNAMSYIDFRDLQEDVVKEVTKCWLSALGDMDGYQKYVSYDSSYEQQLGASFLVESGGSYTVAGTRCILLLRPQERTVSAVHQLLTGMGWERDSEERIAAPKEPPNMREYYQRTYDRIAEDSHLYPESGDEQ